MIFGEVFKDGFGFGFDWLFPNIEEKAAEIGEIVDSNFVKLLVVESFVEQFFVVDQLIKLAFLPRFMFFMLFYW